MNGPGRPRWVKREDRRRPPPDCLGSGCSWSRLSFSKRVPAPSTGSAGDRRGRRCGSPPCQRSARAPDTAPRDRGYTLDGRRTDRPIARVGRTNLPPSNRSAPLVVTPQLVTVASREGRKREECGTPGSAWQFGSPVFRFALVVRYGPRLCGGGAFATQPYMVALSVVIPQVWFRAGVQRRGMSGRPSTVRGCRVRNIGYAHYWSGLPSCPLSFAPQQYALPAAVRPAGYATSLRERVEDKADRQQPWVRGWL
jgi:hypothetical protein